MSAPSAHFIVSPTAAARCGAARDWILAQPSGEGLTVIGETLAGPHELLLRAARSAGASMGWRRTTLRLLAHDLALSRLASSAKTVGDADARDAVVARALTKLGQPELGRLTAVADTPGFISAMGRALDTLRMAGVTTAEIAAVDRDLATFAEAVAAEWRAARLADRASVFEAALSVVRDPASRHPALETRFLIFDARIWTALEEAFVAALIARGGELLATVPEGDERTVRALEGACARHPDPGRTGKVSPRAAPDGGTNTAAGVHGSIGRLHAHLFGPAPAISDPDDAVTVFSAPGEGREAVEIARRLTALAEAGTPFDRCAILLRQLDDYRPYLEEALSRAGIRPWFALGVRRPNAAGRAFLALLRCRTEDFSALRFAEYVSIGEVPDDEGRGEPNATAKEGMPPEYPERVPRRWEQLLVDAAVVRGFDRWERRLAALAGELDFRRAALQAEDAEHPRLVSVDRMRANLDSLRAYALPLLAELSELPAEARWEDWLAALRALATRSLRRPENVVATLAALAPMGPLGPVKLDEVLRVLTPRLSAVNEPPPPNRYGQVFVGPIDAARGLDFDVVFIPGLAERVFPPKIGEDPIILDELRDRLAPGRLIINRDRVRHERLAFRLAVGAARSQVVMSYPRIDAMKTRPRVPSFYTLEAVHASEGRLPGFEELEQRAEEVSDARIGWPAPRSREQAIDEAEYDLAVLDELDRDDLRGGRAVKAAGHLLHSNPHLARALRFRAYRWEVPRWTWADGLVQLSERAASALAERSPHARPYSATALQNFAACPYRFYLHAIQGLRPREAPTGIEALDPLQRGSLVHQVQFELLTRLQSESAKERPLFPVNRENGGRVSDLLEEVLEKVAADFRDRLVPAIDRVWDDGIEAIRQDLREWLQRESRSESPFEPWRFELSFGLPQDPNRDAHSVMDPVDLDIGLKLRGAIDLIERTPSGVLRVTDHKTGRYRANAGATIQGGELLQPVLYALAAQALFPGQRVESGRLYYCTADGEFRDHVVPLDERAIEGAEILAGIVHGAFEGGSFPALPREGACRWCDYRQICGPDEERRTRRKPAPVALRRLREYP